MTGAVVVVLLSLVCAAGVLVALLATHRPPEGWGVWLRSSLAGWRRDEDLAWKRADEEPGEGDLEDLLRLSEPVTGSAYTRPEDLRDTFAAVTPRARRAPGRR
ncbi:hypothetical protein [Georgenia faecalis]|uniref:Uncharacterized protein n=1 Tax=Georgenia faecalis TaxID=2483799 RepID=A0ABV9DCQ5_9MICO|nr:hypothetical protein [Georgenia faecalis]